MTPEAMHTQSANQIIGKFLAGISDRTVKDQLDAITTMIRRTFDSEMLTLLLCEFNNLAARDENTPASANQPDREEA